MDFFTKEKQICRYQKQTYDYQKGNVGVVVVRDKSGAWDEHMQTTIYKTDNQ